MADRLPLAAFPGDRGETVRLALPAEAGACAGLIAAAFAAWIPVIGRVPGPMADDPAVRITAGQCWVLPWNDSLAGVLVLEEKPNEIWLDTIAIDPALRGQGHGRHLIAFAEAEAQRRGHARLRLYTHVLMATNRALYARLGYAETRFYAEDGFERVVMEKPLG